MTYLTTKALAGSLLALTTLGVATLASGNEVVFDVSPKPSLIILDADKPGDTDASDFEASVGSIAPVPPVTFNDPLLGGGEAVRGRSISELIAGMPIYPPIEGLPAELWQEQTCSNCHQWEKENVCDQAKVYLKPAVEASINKPHPYGGSFKANLRVWAESGCQ